jgi:pimeloyl-ACP methyl ester carboxylesterase
MDKMFFLSLSHLILCGFNFDSRNTVTCFLTLKSLIMAIEKFIIETSGQELEDLQYRLISTRWPDTIQGSEWSYGADLSYMRELCTYWAKEFNWQAQVEKLNKLQHFKTDIEGHGLHFIHEKGKGKQAVPLLLTHGFPDSFFRFYKLIPLLTAADAEGFSFDVIIPSIPGFGYSDKPAEPGMSAKKIADLFASLMKEIGIEKYFAHGGDWGSSITEQLGLHHAETLQGIHLTDIPYKRIFSVDPKELTGEEQQYVKAGQQWSQKEGAYAMIQSTRPQTLAYGVNDSPAGLAAWITDLFRAWCDCNGNIENKFTKDELLTNISIYWFTQTTHSSFRIYFESRRERSSDGNKKVEVPTAGAIFPKDLVPAPESIAGRFYNVKQWTKMPSGGHFAALEEPEMLAEDIRRFAKSQLV